MFTLLVACVSTVPTIPLAPARTETCPEVDAPALSGATWAAAGALPATGLHTIASDGGAPIWLASHSTGVWRAGADLAWDDLVLGVTHTVSEIALRPGDPDRAFRSAGGQVERTRDGGVTWTSLPLGIPDGRVDEVRALTVTPWAPDRVLAIQESGAASISEDDGETWLPVGYAPVREPPAVDDPFHLWGWRLLPEVEDGGRVVFGDGFGVAVSDDGMRTWTRTLDTPLGGYALLRDPLDARHVLAGAPDGLYASFDEGSTWSLREIDGDGISGAWAGDGSWLAIVGTTDVLVSDDAGATFTARPHPIAMPSGAAILDDGRLLVTDHMGVWVSINRGAHWADASFGLEDRGVSVVLADPSCPARVWAGSRCGGGLYRSEDYGETWAPDHTFFHYVMGLHPDAHGRLWAVSDDRLLVTTDRGQFWREAWQRYHFHGFAAHPDDPDQLLIGSVGSGEWADDTMRVYRSDDGGDTWIDSADGLPETDASAHALLRWPGDPDVVLLGTYKGGDVSHRTGEGVGLWRSEDDGATWAQVDLAVVDVATLAPAGDAVLAATDAGIARSEDGGVTWTIVLGPASPVLAVALGEPGTPGEAVGLALGADGTAWHSDDTGRTWFEHDTELPRNPSTQLAQVSVSADGTVGYVTVFDHGVFRIGL